MHKLLTILAFLLIGSVANAEENNQFNLTDMVNAEIQKAEPMKGPTNLTFSEIDLIRKNLEECIDIENAGIPSLTYVFEFNSDGSVLNLNQVNIFDYGIENYYEITSKVTKSLIDCKVIANPGKYESWKDIELTIDLGQ